ncbi:50S ribosomal protein L17 [Patescibacteria group bacterium]|nr:50S ribosomal protein L17 [Patescibacteria group bacterium]
MKHGVYGRKLGRNKDERKRLFRDIARALITHGRLHTTLAKAKSVQGMVEKLITKTKRATNGSLLEVKKTLSDVTVTKLLVDMAKTRFAGRNSGYTRIVKLGARRGDASEMVYLEFVDAAPEKPQTKATKVTKTTKDGNAVQEAEVVVEKPVKAKKTVKAAKSTK